MLESGLYVALARVAQNLGLKARMRVRRKRRSASQMATQIQTGGSKRPLKMETWLLGGCQKRGEAHIAGCQDNSP